MAKFYGPIGYAVSVQTAPGVWTDVITEHNYYGDFVKNTTRIKENENLNDNLVLDNRLSIVGTMYAYDNYQAMRYVKWMGALWKISSVDVQRPRLILSIGSVYNGPVPIPEIPEV